MSATPLTVGDLFCGAGGFAEGFRQAGHKIAWGVDNWEPAITTFRKNFPEAKGIQADVNALDPSQLDHVDILIGSPPCVHFSPANRGGNGDREAGMKLVRRFLTFVRYLRPKYWVMENVPALRYDLEERMEGGSFVDPPLSVRIPVTVVLDASEFGTPQSRRRLFSGNFPIPLASPQEDDRHVISLRVLLKALPGPASGPNAWPRAVQDPVYHELAISPHALRDHFEDSRWILTNEEVRSSEERKLRDRIYGVMPFPDDLDKPARTITSTRTRGSRSTIVVPNPGGADPPFRTLTLRECASAQGFPLSYQFWADAMSSKDFLVGNAVPPPLARAIGLAILHREGVESPIQPILAPTSGLPPVLAYRRSNGKGFSMQRRFRGGVRIDWRRDHRVELDNELPLVDGGLPADAMPPITWRARLYLGYAVRYRCYEIGFDDSLRLAKALVDDPRGIVEPRALAQLILSVAQIASKGFPDGLALQEQWSGWRPRNLGPMRVLSLVSRQVGRAFPSTRWGGQSVPSNITDRALRTCLVYRGRDATRTQPIDASVRLLAAAISLSLICEGVNVGNERLERLLSVRLSSKDIDPDGLAGLFGAISGQEHGSSPIRAFSSGRA